MGNVLDPRFPGSGTYSLEEQNAYVSMEQDSPNISFLHSTTLSQEIEKAPSIEHYGFHKGGQNLFEGVFIVTLAERLSVMSIKQYESYPKEYSVSFNKSCMKELKELKKRKAFKVLRRSSEKTPHKNLCLKIHGHCEERNLKKV